MLVYLDTSIVVYDVEGSSVNQARARTRLSSLLAAGDRLAVSDLTELECYVLPIRQGNTALRAAFDHFFANPLLLRIPLPTAVYRRATLIRAHHKFRLADALHLAAAVEGSCDRFLTADVRLQTYPDIPVEILP